MTERKIGMRSAGISLLFMLAGILAAQETVLMRWSNSARDMMGDRMYFSKPAGAAFLAEADPSVKTPDGGAVLRIRAQEQKAQEKLHEKMICYWFNGVLKPGTRYRLTFDCRASRELQFRAECGLARKPFTKIAGANRILKAGPEWRRVELEFTTREGFGERTALPRLLLGELPLEADLRIGPVELTEIGGNREAAATNPSANLRPESPMDLILPPDRDTSLSLNIKGFSGDPIRYVLTGYDGKETGISGDAVPEGGKIRIPLKLSRGFYELYFPGCGQRIGIVASPRQEGPPDPFWGVNAMFQGRSPIYENRRTTTNYMDGAFETTALVGEYCRFLNYAGISRLREMSGFAFRSSREGTVDFNRERMVEIMKLANDNGLRFLIFYMIFPQYLGAEFGKKSDSPFPYLPMVRFFDKMEQPFLQMLEKEREVTSGLQVYNEQDMLYKNTPPDTVSSLTWAVRYWKNRSGMPYPLVGMSFAGLGITGFVPESYWENYRKNGYWEAVDVFALNSYSTPQEFRRIMAYNMEQLLAHSSAPYPRFQVTESNRWFMVSGKRSPMDEDNTMANMTVRKGVEARAFGAERYFLFCLLFFDEAGTGKNFSMFDFYQTPHRLCAAYMTLAAELRDSVYVGDLPPVEGFDPIRVFRRNGENIAVLSSDGEPSIRLNDFNALSLTGIDGSAAAPDRAGFVRLRGGVGYLKLADSAGITADTDAMKFYRVFSALPERPARAGYPVVLRHHFEDFDRNMECYFVPGRKFRIRVTAFNLSGEEQKIAPVLSSAGNVFPEKTVTIPPRSQKLLIWELDMKDADSLQAEIRDPSGKASPLCMVYRNPREHERLLAGAGDPKNWSRNCNGNDMTIERDEAEKAVKFTARFAMTGNHWFFPEYRLSGEETLRGATELSFEMKVDPETARQAKILIYFLQNTIPEKYAYRPDGKLDVNGGWKTFRVRLAMPDGICGVSPGIASPAPAVSTFRLRNLRIR